eukprot:GHVO01058161.1.p1 GENE.GHVO01058161.1~~GHVO01058161.1.p1  ORF type:complete len:199 (+),score=7.45 GHVO01058161.1:253-849(+)
MQDHISHVLNKGRIAKTHLMRMRPYCTPAQLLALYKTLVWSALEHGNVCYAHASEVQLRKLDSFQESTLRMLGLTNNILAMSVRRKTAHAAMIFKQTVQRQPPNNTGELFPEAPPDPRAHLRRASTTCHAHQLSIRRSPRDLKIYELFCKPFRTFNSLPADLFPQTQCISQFKRCVTIFFESGKKKKKKKKKKRKKKI